MPLDCEESVGHSCGCPFGLSSETGLLVTTSFSGSDRMDNVLKDHRPTQTLCWLEWGSNRSRHLLVSPSRQAITSSSARTASATAITGRASIVNAGSIEQNLCTISGSSQSTSKCPPQSPTRTTKNSILKFAGAFH